MSEIASKKPLIPFWAQGLIGAGILAILAFIVLSTTFYRSDWSEVNSNFYRNGMDALSHSRINVYQGPVPTLIMFWEMDCDVCKESLRYLKKVRDPLNVVGVHLSLSEIDKIKAQKWWLANAPRKSPLYFDSQNMMEKTFQLRTVPAAFLIYPLESKMLINVGNLKVGKPNIRDLARKANNKAKKRR